MYSEYSLLRVVVFMRHCNLVLSLAYNVAFSYLKTCAGYSLPISLLLVSSSPTPGRGEHRYCSTRKSIKTKRVKKVKKKRRRPSREQHDAAVSPSPMFSPLLVTADTEENKNSSSSLEDGVASSIRSPKNSRSANVKHKKRRKMRKTMKQEPPRDETAPKRSKLDIIHGDCENSKVVKKRRTRRAFTRKTVLGLESIEYNSLKAKKGWELGESATPTFKPEKEENHRGQMALLKNVTETVENGVQDRPKIQPLLDAIAETFDCGVLGSAVTLPAQNNKIFLDRIRTKVEYFDAFSYTTEKAENEFDPIIGRIGLERISTNRNGDTNARTEAGTKAGPEVNASNLPEYKAIEDFHVDGKYINCVGNLIGRDIFTATDTSHDHEKQTKEFSPTAPEKSLSNETVNLASGKKKPTTETTEEKHSDGGSSSDGKISQRSDANTKLSKIHPLDETFTSVRLIEVNENLPKSRISLQRKTGVVDDLADHNKSYDQNDESSKPKFIEDSSYTGDGEGFHFQPADALFRKEATLDKPNTTISLEYVDKEQQHQSLSRHCKADIKNAFADESKSSIGPKLLVHAALSPLNMKTISPSYQRSQSRNEFIVSAVTWNLAEASPSEDESTFIQRLCKGNEEESFPRSDFVLVAGQECENIKPRRAEGHRSREFRRIVIQMLGKERKIVDKLKYAALSDVTCGIGNVFHNKGAIGCFVRMKPTHDTRPLRLVFVCAHMAAHVKNSDTRDADFWRIMSELETQAPDWFMKPSGSSCNGTKLQEVADFILFCGDLNYRIDLPREEVDNAIAEFDSADKRDSARRKLMSSDQLRASIASEKAFPGFCEGEITFRPTFKFDKGTNDYDSSKKQRVPAWTDRILYKSKHAVDVVQYDCASTSQHSDHRPVYGKYRMVVSPNRLQT